MTCAIGEPCVEVVAGRLGALGVDTELVANHPAAQNAEP